MSERFSIRVEPRSRLIRPKTGDRFLAPTAKPWTAEQQTTLFFLREEVERKFSPREGQLRLALTYLNSDFSFSQHTPAGSRRVTLAEGHAGNYDAGVRLRRSIRDGVFLALCALLLGCASAQEPAPPPPPAMQVIGEWGEAGDGPGKMNVPVSLATDADGLVYVADAGSGFVNKFDWNGQALYAFEHPRMKRPSGIAVDSGGAIYVADYSAERVFVFYPDGRLLRELRGGPGRAFRGPAGVAVDDGGYIYVLEFDGARVQKFNSRGRFVAAWGKEGDGEGEFRYPADIAMGPDGFVYVADTHGARVQKFTRAGEFVTAWSVAGAAGGEMAEATGLTVTERFAFVADARNLRVQAWSTDGALRHSDALGESFRGQYETPTDVAVGRGGELLVLDPAKPRVLRVKVNF